VSRTCSSGNLLSTTGLMTPLSTSRVISQLFPVDAHEQVFV
jgi:hypothetical protein